METLELEQNPVVATQRDERRAEHIVTKPLARPTDLLERDHSWPLVGLFGELGQVGAHCPELGEHLVLDQTGE